MTDYSRFGIDEDQLPPDTWMCVSTPDATHTLPVRDFHDHDLVWGLNGQCLCRPKLDPVELPGLGMVGMHVVHHAFDGRA